MSPQSDGDPYQAHALAIGNPPEPPDGEPVPQTEVPGAELDPAVRLADLVASAIGMQPRFKAEPVFARTGTGFLESAGVSEMAAAKRADFHSPDSSV